MAALFYSLIESAKLCGVEPRAYLREAMLRVVRDPGAVTRHANSRPRKPEENEQHDPVRPILRE